MTDRMRDSAASIALLTGGGSVTFLSFGRRGLEQSRIVGHATGT